MKSIRSALATLILALSLNTTSVLAASYSTDQSDLWWADPPSSENGWGFQIVQRGSTIFITIFVYGPAGAPTWYVATMTPTPPGSLVWSGDLYVTAGPWFGSVPYNPALFALRKVGTTTWTSTAVNTGTLLYTVDGVAVTKHATRQTLVSENYGGHFAVGTHETDTGCANPLLNGTFENAGVVNTSQNGAAFTMTTFPANGGATCAFTGTLSQSGQMGDVQGTYFCTNGSAGSVRIFEFQVTSFSVSGRYTASGTVPLGCQASGWFAGLKVTTF